MPLNDFRSVFMPYCLRRQENGSYAVLNREYRPLGFWSKEDGTGPVAAPLPITQKRAEKLSCKGSSNNDDIYLYDDGCLPTSSDKAMREYLDRLALLMSFELKQASTDR